MILQVIKKDVEKYKKNRGLTQYPGMSGRDQTLKAPLEKTVTSDKSGLNSYSALNFLTARHFLKKPGQRTISTNIR
jgi:hypothetical protein